MRIQFFSVVTSVAGMAIATFLLAGCGDSAESAAMVDGKSTTTTTAAGASVENACSNVSLTSAVERQLLLTPRGDRAPNATVGSPTFVGKCGLKTYAIVSLDSPAGTTEADGVKYQDGPDLFTGNADGSWTYVSDTGGACPAGTFPSDLLKVWDVCLGDVLK